MVHGQDGDCQLGFWGPSAHLSLADNPRLCGAIRHFYPQRAVHRQPCKPCFRTLYPLSSYKCVPYTQDETLPDYTLGLPCSYLYFTLQLIHMEILLSLLRFKSRVLHSLCVKGAWVSLKVREGCNTFTSLNGHMRLWFKSLSSLACMQCTPAQSLLLI